MLDLDAPPALSLAEISMPSAHAELLTINDGPDMIGYLMLRTYPGALLVSDVFVIPECREAGVGGELLDLAIQVSEEFERDLVLRVAGNGAPNTRTDDELLEWYHRYGFDTHPEWEEPSVLIRRVQ